MELTHNQREYLTEIVTEVIQTTNDKFVDAVIDKDSIQNLANKFFDTNEVIEQLTIRASRKNKSSCVHMGWVYAANIIHRIRRMNAMTNLAQQLVNKIEKEGPYVTKQSSK